MWAYAVTCWEILNYCSRIPYEGLNNADLIENAERMLAGNENSVSDRYARIRLTHTESHLKSDN